MHCERSIRSEIQTASAHELPTLLVAALHHTTQRAGLL